MVFTGKTDGLDRNLSQVPLRPQIPLELPCSNPVVCGEEPDTNHLGYGTAYRVSN
jgi:hypothetical protein